MSDCDSSCRRPQKDRRTNLLCEGWEGSEDEGRRMKRREKNRVAAQKSRRRQTERADVLHQTCELLEQRNRKLRREEDIHRLGTFQEQTVIVVKAPEETKLEVPAPKEDSIQVHLKGGKGPISVLTCEVGTGDATSETSSCFVTLEESRIKTSVLHTESSSPQSAVQSA